MDVFKTLSTDDPENESDPLQGALEEVRYRTVSGWLKGASVSDELSILVHMDGRSVALGYLDGQVAAMPDSRRFHVVLPNEPNALTRLQALVLDTERRAFRVLTWGEDMRSLPDAWRAGRYSSFPSFFLLGAAKCGTTSLHTFLDQHPDILMSKPKEPFFFELEYGRGTGFYFGKYFGGWKGEPIVGESRHRHLYLPYVARRIHAYNPNAKLIAILRNPAERAVSHWWHWYSRHLEPLQLEHALSADLARIRESKTINDPETISQYQDSLGTTGQGCYRTYLDSGYYCEQLQRYIDLFGWQRLHVILSEDLAADPKAVTNNLFRFLGLESPPNLGIDYTPVNQRVEGMQRYLTDKIRGWLIAHYEPYNRKLASLLGRTLDWDRCF